MRIGDPVGAQTVPLCVLCLSENCPRISDFCSQFLQFCTDIGRNFNKSFKTTFNMTDMFFK